MTVAAASTKRPILNGLKAFRQFLNQQRPALAAAPVLIVESDDVVDSNDKNNKQQQPSDAMKHVQLLCTSIGLRTATSHPSTSHFPFLDDITTSLKLAQRIGAETVIGVGSTGSIELAKALAQHGQGFEHLLLVPSTPSATLLGASQQQQPALLMDPSEPALVPAQQHHDHDPSTTSLWMPPNKSLESSHLVLLESSILQSTMTTDRSTLSTAMYSALVLCIDELCRHKNSSSGDTQTSTTATSIAMIQKALEVIQQLENDNVELKDYEADLQQVLTWAGSSLSFGFAGAANDEQNNYRSIPLALAASLVPTEFSDYTLFQFLSCLLPGMFKILEGTEHRNVALELKGLLETCPRLSDATTGGEDDVLSTQGMIARVHDNHYLWGCMDADDSLLKVVLDASLPASNHS